MDSACGAFAFGIFLQNYMKSLRWIVLPNDFEILDFKVIRLVNKKALTLVTEWKKLEYPKIPGIQLMGCLNKLQSSQTFSVSVSGDYGRYNCDVQYQYDTMYIKLACQGGPKRRQYNFWESTWFVTKTSMDIICKDYSCKDYHGHECYCEFDGCDQYYESNQVWTPSVCTEDSCCYTCYEECDRSLILLTLRLMHAPLYLLSEFEKTCCFHDLDDEVWFHSDVCISCGMNVYYNWDENVVEFPVDEIRSVVKN